MEELTDLVLDIISHTGHFVEESERLVHALLNNAQVGQHLLNISNMMFFYVSQRKKQKKKHSTERAGSTKSTLYTKNNKEVQSFFSVFDAT